MTIFIIVDFEIIDSVLPIIDGDESDYKRLLSTDNNMCLRHQFSVHIIVYKSTCKQSGIINDYYSVLNVNKQWFKVTVTIFVYSLPF